MRYYSEDDVISIMRDVEDSVTAYEWGCGNRNVKLADYPSIEIPDSSYHTGTPTEEGWYLVVLPDLVANNNGSFYRYETDYLNSKGNFRLYNNNCVIAWRKIYLYTSEVKE